MVHHHDQSWYKSTWAHRAWSISGCTTVLISLAKSIFIITTGPSIGPMTWLQLSLASLLGYVLADLGSGVYHWAIDNYGCPETPIFGPTIESFLEHHQEPLELSKCDTAATLHRPAAVATVAVLPINMFSCDPGFLWFVGVLSGLGIFNIQFHAWAHVPKRNLPAVVAALQDAGVILRWAEHAKHHRAPFNSNYCSVNGVCNRVLDKYKIFVALEVVVFRVSGLRPRSWAEAHSGRIQKAQKPTS